MDQGEILVTVWLLAPVALVSLVWGSWAKGRGEAKKWRRTATLVSAIGTTASSGVMAGLLLWANVASIAPATSHPSLFTSLLFIGVGLSIISVVVVIFGTGWLRWLIIPAATLQGLSWSLMARIATTPLFPG